MKYGNRFPRTLAIVALGGAIGTSTHTANATVSPGERALSDIKYITTALQGFHDACGIYPTTTQGLGALVGKPADFAGTRWVQFLAGMLMDPWKHPYQYVYPGVHNPTSYDVFSLGPDGKPDGDDIGNWSQPDGSLKSASLEGESRYGKNI